MWYTAHLIQYLKYSDGNQNDFPVYENLVLVQADTPEKAFTTAKDFGRQQEVEITLDGGRLARWTFAGVRSIVECQAIDNDDLSQPNNFIPTHGTEVSYIEMSVASQADLDKLVAGQAVNVRLEDANPLSEEEIAALLKPYSENLVN